MALSTGAAIALGLGSIGSSAVSGLASNASSYKQYKYQRNLMDRQSRLNYEYAEKSARNQPTWNRAGLENAGYNPMLAVQNSTSGANSSWTSGGQASAPDYVGAISQGVANAQSFQRLKNETTVSDKTSEKLDSEIQNINADTSNKLEENKYIGEKRKKEIAQIQADILEKEARINNMQKQIELGQMGITVQQEANANQAEYNRVLERNNKRTNRVNTSLEHIRHPFASFAHKSYTSGKGYKGSYSDPWSK